MHRARSDATPPMTATQAGGPASSDGQTKRDDDAPGLDDDAFDLDVAALELPEAHPFDPSAKRGIRRTGTHISHLVFTDERVYKFRKPVDLGFLDFSSIRERNEDCLREVALNRRLAPDVYLGVAPLFDEAPTGPFIGHIDESLCGGPEGPYEHCVVMRRLPEGGDAESHLRAGRLGPERVESMAALLADFHGTNRLWGDHLGGATQYLEHVQAPARASLAALQGRVGGTLLARVRAAQEKHFERIRASLERRRRLGLTVDGHGDLRLEHVWFEDGRPPVVIDCIEFDADLRRTDPANDVGFLLADLDHRSAPAAAGLFLQSYVWETDDYGILPVLDYFQAHAAGVRAKVASIEDAERSCSVRAEARLERALEWLERRQRPAIFVLSGLVGTGKSSVARAIAMATDGIVVCSDRVRQRLDALLAVGTDDLYDERRKAEVYDGLFARAAAILESGRPAVLDASFDRPERRAMAIELAREWDCRVVFVETRCAPDVARARLAERQADGGDPSDAGPERFADSEAAFQPIEDVPEWAHWVLDTTSGEDWPDELAARLVQLG